jgi:hypothetical protein
VVESLDIVLEACSKYQEPIVVAVDMAYKGVAPMVDNTSAVQWWEQEARGQAEWDEVQSKKKEHGSPPPQDEPQSMAWREQKHADNIPLSAAA